MDGSNEKVVSLLERIAERLETMDARLDKMDARLDKFGSELHGMRQDLNRRMDSMIAFMGTHHGDHEERIRVLEERVLGKPKG